MTEDQFRAHLAAAGLTLQGAAFAAAWAGANHLLREIARLDAFLAEVGPPK